VLATDSLRQGDLETNLPSTATASSWYASVARSSPSFPQSREVTERLVFATVGAAHATVVLSTP